MRSIKEILDAKGHGIYTVEASAFVYDALKLMAEKDVGALLVFESDTLVGIFSERDYARKIILLGKFSKETIVRDAMESEITSMEINQSLEESMLLMTEKKTRHIPVYEQDELIGVISIGDVVKAIISDKDGMIKDLENYISGTR